MRPRTLAGSIWVLAFALAPTTVMAQADKGSLLGNVTDSSQAPVPQAAIQAIETSTGVAHGTLTNEAGNYSFPLLDPGVYRVEAERPGFKKGVRDNVLLTVNSAARADFILEVGAVTESIEVSASAAVLQTDRADVSAKIDSDALQNLPLSNNRNYENTFVLVPGTTMPWVAHSNFYDSAESLSTEANGQDRHYNNFLLEGINNNWDEGNLSVLVPPIEAIQTVDVSTSNYDAEFGRVAGAVLNVTLRSGTNQFHGSLFEFNKNGALYSRNFFYPTVTPVKYNQWGGVLGGPIKKNKLFFFIDYQGSINHDSGGQNYTIPSMPFRSGNLQASTTTVYDPTSGTASGTGRTPFPGNIIPPGRISPIATALLNDMPAPTYPGLAANFAGQWFQKKMLNNFDIKIDHQWNANNSLAFRYSYQMAYVSLSPIFNDILGGPGQPTSGGSGFAGSGHSRAQVPGVSWVHIFSTSLLTQLRIGVTRIRNDANQPLFGTPTAQQFGIPGVNIDQYSSGIPEFTVTGYDSPMIGYNNALPWRRAQTDYSIVNTWNKVAGNHTFKWGFDTNRELNFLLQWQSPTIQGLFTFTAGPAALNGDSKSTNGMANAFASFLLDLPNAMSRQLDVEEPESIRGWYFLFFTDKWQVNRKLTLDLGIRKEFWPTTKNPFKGMQVDYDPTDNSLLVGGYGNIPRTLGIQPDLSAVAPRIGLAYRLNDKTVIRGGFGTSYRDYNTGVANFPASQSPAYTAPNSYSAAGSMAAGFPAPNFAQIPANGIIPNAPLNLSYSIATKNPHHPYIESWNLSIQRQLPGGFALDTSYVGNHNVNTSTSINLNHGAILNAGPAGQPYYQTLGKTTSISQQFLYLTGRYDALQVKLTRRLAHGLTSNTAYTYAHGYSGYVYDYASPQNVIEYAVAKMSGSQSGGDNIDRRHHFVQSLVYQLPIGPKGRWLRSGVAAAIVGGWQVNGVFTAMTGLPMTLSCSATSLNTPGATQRCNVNGPVTTLGGIGSGNPWLDTTAFSAPVGLTFGNLGPQILAGPGLVNLDSSLFRKFQVRERMNLDLRFETFNTTNTAHFANPGTTLGSSTFGVVTTTQSIGNNRGAQVGAKLVF